MEVSSTSTDIVEQIKLGRNAIIAEMLEVLLLSLARACLTYGTLPACRSRAHGYEPDAVNFEG